MKQILIIPDGFADRPIDLLRGRTPIEAARTPHMDSLAIAGKVGLSSNIPKGMKPGSDVACMSLLGYDPNIYHTGRAPLEAVSLGVELADDQVAFRANLVTVADGVMVDYSAGHIRTEEARVLLGDLAQAFSSQPIRLYAGSSYRHLLVTERIETLKARTTPPHDISGKSFSGYMPKGKGSDLLASLMEESTQILDGHDVNEVRVSLGENPANMMWLWGGGTRTELPGFQDKWGLKGTIITAVDLLRSIGMLAGLDILEVDGATGYLDTNYAAKGRAAVQALDDYDFVVVHVEAPDEAGHGGKALAKLKSLERIDADIVGPVLDAASQRGDVRIMVSADHATPIELRTHTADPVPYVLWGPGFEAGGASAFNEVQAAASGNREKNGYKMLGEFLGVSEQV
jgi:2,3-bisphosphoglycerate-independent phosphoglycerate mutase